MPRWIGGIGVVGLAMACAPSLDDESTRDTAGAQGVDSADTGATMPVDTAPPEPVELTPDRFSYVGQAALAALDAYSGSRYVTWNYSADATFDMDWILQTPEGYHWGTPAEDFDENVS